jgi:hypothetical protein
MDMRLKLVGRALTGQGKDQAMMQGHSHSCPPRIYFLIGLVGFPLGKFCTGRFMLAFFSHWMAPGKIFSPLFRRISFLLARFHFA